MKDISRRNFLENTGATLTGLTAATLEQDNMESPEELKKYILEEAGHNYDIKIPEELFEENKQHLHETSLTTVTQHFPEALSYRDDEKIDSVHVTDYRGIEREELESDVIVGHLERYNPEHRPVMHALIDYPLWHWKNRIRENTGL